MAEKPMPMPEKPMAEMELVCDGPNLLRNGNFEGGFQPDGVAHYWVGWNNGGRANYGYYDDTWPPVVSEGEHSQLVEINTLDVGDATDENRLAGIYQKVWLHPGATYEISLDAMMREREDHSDEDFYRYMVEWGYSKDGATDVENMDYWDRVVLDEIYLRTEPGEMQSYSARFEAPSAMTTIWLMAIKKWATLERELDVNLDNVQLRACRPAKAMWPMHDGAMMPDMSQRPMMPMQPEQPMGQQSMMPMRPQQPAMAQQPMMPERPMMACTTYIVRRGDTLGQIATAHGTTVAAIARASNIADPNWIHVGQQLCIPGGASAMAEPAAMPAEQPMGPSISAPQAPMPTMQQPSQPAMGRATALAGGQNAYQVQRGDTLSSVAANFGVSIQGLKAANGMSNPNWIYVGQMLTIPMS
jgi:LysM repeat protein